MPFVCMFSFRPAKQQESEVVDLLDGSFLFLFRHLLKRGGEVL